MTDLLTKKAKALKALFLDVDGVLTDGTFFLTPDGQEIKRFNTQDGFGMKQLQKHGVMIAIISGRKSKTVDHRMKELDVGYVFQGIDSKINIYKQLQTKLSLKDNQIAYMGDDLPDLRLIEQAGFGIAPNNAVIRIKTAADWVTTHNGGFGAVREVCDFILNAQRSQFTL
jgi:3-deoxy-D-manno-octulosonate 8-phosphate phosphatase (KDO 8-P phosphatase)